MEASTRSHLIGPHPKAAAVLVPFPREYAPVPALIGSHPKAAAVLVSFPREYAPVPALFGSNPKAAAVLVSFPREYAPVPALIGSHPKAAAVLVSFPREYAPVLALIGPHSKADRRCVGCPKPPDHLSAAHRHGFHVSSLYWLKRISMWHRWMGSESARAVIGLAQNMHASLLDWLRICTRRYWIGSEYARVVIGLAQNMHAGRLMLLGLGGVTSPPRGRRSSSIWAGPVSCYTSRGGCSSQGARTRPAFRAPPCLRRVTLLSHLCEGDAAGGLRFGHTSTPAEVYTSVTLVGG
eukprot:1191495-Prorocentrum_minimum.AAC.1